MTFKHSTSAGTDQPNLPTMLPYFSSSFFLCFSCLTHVSIFLWVMKLIYTGIHGVQDMSFPSVGKGYQPLISDSVLLVEKGTICTYLKGRLAYPDTLLIIGVYGFGSHRPPLKTTCNLACLTPAVVHRHPKASKRGTFADM
jgi:hypothetical protein